MYSRAFVYKVPHGVLLPLKSKRRDLIGFEAAVDTEKCPINLTDLSKRVVKAILEHDTHILQSKQWGRDSRPAHTAQRWKIKRNPKRLSPHFFAIGEKVKGRVAVTFPSYALIDVGATCYGVLHARDISDGWIERVDLFLHSGDDMIVYIKEMDERGRFLHLSLRDFKGQGHGNVPRRDINSFEVEEVVSGTVTRRSCFGFYVDIGASVDAFLHSNDRKLPLRYTGVRRRPLYVGAIIPTLYIKCVDLIRNRIKVSENSYVEELDKRNLVGQETLEKQSFYTADYKRDFMTELKTRDIQAMRQTGALDDYLKEIGGHRNSTMEHIFYLEREHQIKHLRKQQDKLIQEKTTTKAEARRMQDKYNEYAREIARINEVTHEPDPHERSIYNYGNVDKVWRSRCYTPFDEKDTKSYFGTVSSELQSALKDVQGENFNFATVFQNAPDTPKSRLELVDYLYKEFHKPPSNMSNIPDNVNRSPRIKDYEELEPQDAPDEPPRESIDDIIKKLESFNNPDATHLAEMIKETRNFDPTRYSKRFIDSDASAIRGACALFNDDITTFAKRAEYAQRDPERMQAIESIASNILQSDPEPPTMLDGKGNENEIPNIPSHILEALEASQDDYMDPEITTEAGDYLPDTHLLDIEDHMGGDFDNANDQDTEKTETSKSLGNLDETHATSDGHDYDLDSDDDGAVLSDSELMLPPVYRTYLGEGDEFKSDVAPVTSFKGNHCDLKPQMAPFIPMGPLEPKIDHVSANAPPDFIQSIIAQVKQVTTEHQEPSNNISNVDDPEPTEQRRPIPGLAQISKYMDPIAGGYLLRHAPHRTRSPKSQPDITKETSTTIIDESAPSHLKPPDILAKCESTPEVIKNEPELDLSKQELSSKDKRELHSAIGTLYADRKRGLKSIARLATKYLSKEEMALVDNVGKESQTAEELARLMRPEKPRSNMTYYPEGILNYKPPEELYSDNRKIHEANVKLRSLMRNKRFLAMLKRLKISETPTLGNICTLLPRALVRRRLIPQEPNRC
ncbi:bifunctional Nucleic acid-binding [Babesia duncani]|uniref:Bifunctional Nucleic acid-binding n=1 Tax=Babesia duncani TaxID=323732 RepID=A0AAD9UNW9_9APIC|nr:bifunctional Nucleic acid-binding [Babesia duncani]